MIQIPGHKIQRIVFETDKAIYFLDDKGDIWRYLYAFKAAWRVVRAKIEDNRKLIPAAPPAPAAEPAPPAAPPVPFSRNERLRWE